MKVLIYIIASIMIILPLIYFTVSVYYSTTDVIIHDTYMGIGKFRSSPKTFMFLSLVVAFLLLAVTSHISYKEEQEEYSETQ